MGSSVDRLFVTPNQETSKHSFSRESAISKLIGNNKANGSSRLRSKGSPSHNSASSNSLKARDLVLGEGKQVDSSIGEVKQGVPSDYAPPIASCQLTSFSLPQFMVPVEDQPVGGRLSQYWQNWTQVCSDPWIIKTVKEGYRLEIPSDLNIPLTTVPQESRLKPSAEYREAIYNLAEQQLQKGILEEVRDVTSPGYYSRFFIVRKKEAGKWRGILNLSSLNKTLEKQKFKMETAESIRQALQPGDWVTSLDLTDAYHHILIHPKHRKFLRFALGGRVLQYRALPMGLSAAPRIFTRIIKVIREFVQKRLVNLHQYLDDWLTRGANQEVVLHHTEELIQLVQHLGWLVNMDKSDLTPTQMFTFLAYSYNLEEGTVKPTEERWIKLQKKIAPFMKSQFLDAKSWQSLIGLIASTEKLVHMGMLHLRPLQVALNDQWNPMRQEQEHLVEVSETVKTALTWWTNKANVMSGVPLHAQKTQFHVYTDASSLWGWGGYLDVPTNHVQGKWTQEEKEYHINVLEMLASWNVMKHFSQEIQGSTVMIVTDNSTVVAYIRRQGGTRSKTLLNLTQQIFKWAVAHKIDLQCRHIPGKLNVFADSLSRAARTDITHRMGITPQCTATAMGGMGQTKFGLLCNKVQCKTSCVCVTGSRPISIRNRCAIHGVDKSLCICIPANSSVVQGDNQSESNRLCDNTSGSQVAEAAMVCRHDESADRCTDGAAVVEEAPKAATVHCCYDK